MEKNINLKKQIEPRTVKGFRDLSPWEAMKKAEIVADLRKMARSHAFQEIATPALEFAEVLLGASYEDTDKEVYRMEDAGGRPLALRFDLTVPFARFVAQNQNLIILPFKRFQCDEVWRGEKPQKGRFRQFCQADFDILGSDSLESDVLVLQMIRSGLEKILPEESMTMSINSRPLLTYAIRKTLFAADSGLQEDSLDTLIKEVLIGIDKLAKIGAEGVEKILSSKHPAFAKDGLGSELLKLLILQRRKSLTGVEEEESCLELKNFLRGLSNTDSSNLQRSEDYESKLFEDIFSRVRSFRKLSSKTKEDFVKSNGSLASFKIVLDLTIARGLAYYTGIVFETSLNALEGFGSIASGGRYENLVGRFTNRNMSGVGGSIGVDRVLAAIQELASLKSGFQIHSFQEIWSKKPSVFIAVAEMECFEEASRIGDYLRENLFSLGGVVELSINPGAKNLGQQFKYADRSGHIFVMVIGKTEIESKKFKLKHMKSGKETLVEGEWGALEILKESFSKR